MAMGLFQRIWAAGTGSERDGGEQDLARGKGVLGVRTGGCLPRDAPRHATRARGRRCNPGKPPPVSPFGFQAGKKRPQNPHSSLNRINSFACSRLNSFQAGNSAPAGSWGCRAAAPARPGASPPPRLGGGTGAGWVPLLTTSTPCTADVLLFFVGLFFLWVFFLFVHLPPPGCVFFFF